MLLFTMLSRTPSAREKNVIALSAYHSNNDPVRHYTVSFWERQLCRADFRKGNMTEQEPRFLRENGVLLFTCANAARSF